MSVLLCQKKISEVDAKIMDVDLINVAYYFTKGHCIGFQKCDSQ